MTVRKPSSDWEEIEAQYRAGVLSTREIARAHDLTEGAIRKRAKKHNWQHDLRAKVAEMVRAKMVRSTGTQENGTQHHASEPIENETVEQSAAMVVQVISAHRLKIARSIEIVRILLEQLGDAVKNRPQIQAVIEQVTEGDKTSSARNAMMRVADLPSDIAALKGLALALRTLVNLQRLRSAWPSLRIPRHRRRPRSSIRPKRPWPRFANA